MNKPAAQPRIEYLSIRNYRALRSVELRDLKPLTVLIGPNGSGKSTVLDALNFVSEAFRNGLPQAWADRGRGSELKTRGQTGPIEITFRYRERPNGDLISYSLQVDETKGNAVVSDERVTVLGRRAAQPETILHYTKGHGEVITRRPASFHAHSTLVGTDLLAVNVFGQVQDNPILAKLRQFILDWQTFDLAVASVRGQTPGGTQERLSSTGDNLTNVILHLSRSDPERLDRIIRALALHVPMIERALAEEMTDGRLLLRIKDVPFHDPLLARFVSDGTLKLLAYLVLLHQQQPPHFICLEEPENLLHPRLMYPLAEEFRGASGRSQFLVTTHSPYFLDALRPEEVRVLYRNEHGHTVAERTVDLHGIPEFLQHGGALGDLWMEGHFNVGDPLSNSGMPRLAAGVR